MSVTLRLYDTAARGVRDFRPLNPPHVTLYMCGPAVQAPPHIGHLRSAVCFDILIRWLETSGYEVIYCRNVADIDDKIAQATNWWQVAERNLRLFRAAYDLLGCRPPDVEPRAAGHIPQMIQLIGRLIDTGHAYAADGNVYFDVASDPGYGSLSNRDEPADFTLWKAARPGEPSWDAPWGPGRPGRDLACAAMSATYLGSSFDIHGGDRDLLFPHHENERAAGDEHAGYWWHSNYLGVPGGKVSKLAVADVLTRVRPQELRYYLGQSHYRALLEYSEDELDEAAAAYQRIERFVHRASDLLSERTAPPQPARDDLPMSFADAMDADLGVPSALASLHATVRDGNHAIADGDIEEVRAHLTLVRAMLTVLGLDPLDPRWPDTERKERLQAVVDTLVRLALDERDRARQRKDYAAADSIRETLEKIGLVVEDTVQGPRWELRQ